MGGSAAAKLVDLGVPRFFAKRRPAVAPERAEPGPTRVRALHADAAEAVLLVEVDAWEDVVRQDPTLARRIRTRVRRMVGGAVLRYAGHVEHAEGARVVGRFGWGRDAALAAEHVRVALSGERGIPVRIVVHAAEAGARVAGQAVLRDLGRPGDVLLVGEAMTWVGLHREEREPTVLGTYMLAGVPKPVRVAVSEVPVSATPREAATWGAPWMARLGRKGLIGAVEERASAPR